MTAWFDTPGPTHGGPFAEHDAFGRRIPRRLGPPDFLLLIARADPSRVRQVPSAALVEEGNDELGAFILLTCPCGARPVVRRSMARCPGCERHYVAVSRGAVWVAYGAMTPPPLREAEAPRGRSYPKGLSPSVSP